ncbi:hypothetical protein UIS_00499 [Enterococcus faecium EnGen0313]|uniref:hypothetical protein n=1 Tax=Enterococcus faecium TaxID=1352 RepID=UPI00032E5762|nr:hypothetical protein [Enterococcus faecium]EOI43340.1 hypothetical protein UIS_00499 [Enterococcus faecium EnGen0313]
MKKNKNQVAVLFAFVFSLFSVGSLANADEKKQKPNNRYHFYVISKFCLESIKYFV